MSLFLSLTHDELQENFKTSILCVLTLVNSDTIICNAKEIRRKNDIV